MFNRVVAQFTSGETSLSRRFITSILEFSRGRISKEEFIKRKLALVVMIPSLMTLVSNAFDWDDDEQAKAIVVGAMGGFLVLGEIIEAVATVAVTDDRPFSSDIRNPLSSLANVGIGIASGEFDSNFFEAGKAMSDLTGLPIDAAYKMGLAIPHAWDGELDKAWRAALGYSPYTVEKATEEEKNWGS